MYYPMLLSQNRQKDCLNSPQMGLTPLVLLGLGGLSLAVKRQLLSPAKDAIAECTEFMESFQALHPEVEPGNRILDLFPNCIIQHLAPKMSNDCYGDYVKQLDMALASARRDVDCVHTLSDASAPTRGALQASLAALVFWGDTKIAHIVVAGGQATAPNAELMALEMCISTALVVGCTSLVCFTDSTVAMADLVDPSPHSGQVSSLAACTSLQKWFVEDHHRTLHLWHVPSKEEWKIHHEAHEVVKAAKIPLCPGCRVSFDFAWAAKEVAYWKEWHKEFADPRKQGRNFLELVSLNGRPLKPMTLKGGAWSLFLVSGSNSMTARMCRAVVSHAPMGEYRLCFHPGEPTHCWCPPCPLQTRDHIC